MEPERIEAIAQQPLPSRIYDIQVFLSFAGFYRRFIRRYSLITTPLTDLLRGNQGRVFELSPNVRTAFLELLQRFQEAPILVHFDPLLPIRIETNALDRIIRVVLAQLIDGRQYLVAFCSRKLTPVESNYNIGDHELLILIDVFRAQRYYLLYSIIPIVALTDYINLEGLKTKTYISSRQVHQSEDFAEIDFIIKFRPGS